jgi:glucose/arabinose dehydrogenase
MGALLKGRRPRLERRLPLLFALVVLGPPSARATILDTTFTETVVVRQGLLANATGFAWAPDGTNRLFVLNKEGIIRIVKDGTALPTPFDTVRPLVSTSECGLIGIAFDPAFLVTQHVYVMACVSPTEQQVIRYTVQGDVGTEKTIIVGGLPTIGANHDGGALAIGPDGKLYWGIGDLGTGVGTGTDLSSNASKIGRANLDGSPVADNPFADGAGPNSEFIWARGFRNPFTMTFQPATGLLWVNDVGTLYEQVFIVRKGDHAGWSMYENNQPAGFIAPVIKYKTNAQDAYPLGPANSGAVRSGGTATFTTVQPHALRRGEKVVLSGVTDTSFNGELYVSEIPTPTSFSGAQFGPDAASGGGAVGTLALGGCVTGGAFYDSTGFPASYRGNFFFAEFNNQRVLRAVLDPATNHITSVDTWAGSTGTTVDVSVGPDGALYYLAHREGTIYRASYNAPTQALVVTPTNVWIGDGQAAAVMVRLATRPSTATPVTVAISRTAGDEDVTVLSGGALTFSQANWAVPQRATVGLGYDTDATDDVATVTVSAEGLPSERVIVHARDEAGPDLMLSSGAVTIDEGGTGSITVALSRQPFLDLQVTAARSAGAEEITVTGGTPLTFNRTNWSAPQTVTVSAGTNAAAADRSATITLGGSGLSGRSVTVTARNRVGSGAADAGGGPADAPAVEAGDGGVPRDAPAGESRGDAVAGGDNGGCSCELGPARTKGDGRAGALLLLGLAGLLVALGRRVRRG